MKCPNCNETLLMSERNKIEIDYCPSCRGVWLDKGELDKMLAYAEHQNAPQYNARPYDNNSAFGSQSMPANYNRRHKKKSFLGDLFDFD